MCSKRGREKTREDKFHQVLQTLRIIVLLWGGLLSTVPTRSGKTTWLGFVTAMIPWNAQSPHYICNINRQLVWHLGPMVGMMAMHEACWDWLVCLPACMVTVLWGWCTVEVSTPICTFQTQSHDCSIVNVESRVISDLVWAHNSSLYQSHDGMCKDLEAWNYCIFIVIL